MLTICFFFFFFKRKLLLICTGKWRFHQCTCIQILLSKNTFQTSIKLLTHLRHVSKKPTPTHSTKPSKQPYPRGRRNSRCPRRHNTFSDRTNRSRNHNKKSTKPKHNRHNIPQWHSQNTNDYSRRYHRNIILKPRSIRKIPCGGR